MTEREKALREKRIRLAVAEMRYQRACAMPAITARQLTGMLYEIEQMQAELRAESGLSQDVNPVHNV